ncbi:MAG: histidinol dehydrogenase, partial [Acidobacteriota bacterium]|nr:histidinol dehydrogenase [Acidobacteriota bacterium]
MIQIVNLRELVPGLDENSPFCGYFERKRDTNSYEDVVRPIIEAVRRDKDEALRRFAREFDGIGDLPLRITREEMESAAAQMSPNVRQAAEIAIVNIRQFAEAQLPKDRFEEFGPGRKLGWIIRPLGAVGCYIPSGRYPLPSTLLMTAVLAQTAGVPRICVTSPKPSTEILGCAHL